MFSADIHFTRPPDMNRGLVILDVQLTDLELRLEKGPGPRYRTPSPRADRRFTNNHFKTFLTSTAISGNPRSPRVISVADTFNWITL